MLHEDAIRRLSVDNTSHLEDVAVLCGGFDLFALVALLSDVLKDRLSIDILVEKMGARYIEISAHRTEKVSERLAKSHRKSWKGFLEESLIHNKLINSQENSGKHHRINILEGAFFVIKQFEASRSNV